MKRIISNIVVATGLGFCLSASAGTIAPIGPLPPVPENPDNRATPERIALGKALFLDNRISANGRMNCSSCHLPEFGWTLPSQYSIANDGFVERRNPPSLLNVGYNKNLIWDGRAPNLEKQAIGSTKNPVHKGQDVEKLMTVFNDDPKIVKMFDAAYGTKPNVDDYGRAMAVFQRHTLITGDSDFDRYMKGDKTALNDSALAGMGLFKAKAGCVQCHNGPIFSDNEFYNVGLKRNSDFDRKEYKEILTFDAKRMNVAEWETLFDDPGRYLVTHEKSDWKKFKTPSLRNLVDTKPYMHDGRYETIDAVIEHYNRGGDGVENQDPRIKPLGLTSDEKAALKAFLLSLRGSLPEI